MGAEGTEVSSGDRLRTRGRPGWPRASWSRPSWSKLGAIGAALVLVGVAVGGGVVVFDGAGNRSPAAASGSRTAVDAGRVAVAPPIVAPDAPPLPQPEPAPADPYERVAVDAIGQIEIPRIGLVHTMYEGVSLTVLDHGPGHWPGTAEPGGWGNMVIAGHRTTNSRPFRNIDQLVEGDEIIVRNDSGVFTYLVTGSQVVTPEETWIVDQQPGRTITLFACHPPGSAAYRYVVFGALVS